MPFRALGAQLYTVKHHLQESFPETLERVAEIGYREVEFFGPYGFSPADSLRSWQQFAGPLGLTDSGYYGRSPREVRSLLDDLGLRAPSAHVDLPTLRQRLDAALDAAHEVGHRFLVCSFLDAAERASLDAYRRLAEEFNRFGERCGEAGIRFAHHNHCFELGELEGRVPYELLLEETEPERVGMELDLFWTAVAGADPVDLFRRYPGRFPLWHLKDLARPWTAGDPLRLFEQPAELEAAYGEMASVGRGTLRFDRTLAHAAAAGLEHAFVERDVADDPLASLRESHEFLRSMERG